MKEDFSNIDKLLQQVLDNCELDAEGIDWNAFQSKQNRKKRVLFWWSIAAVILVGLTVSLLFYRTSVQPVKVRNTDVIVQNNSAKTEGQINETENRTHEIKSKEKTSEPSFKSPSYKYAPLKTLDMTAESNPVEENNLVEAEQLPEVINTVDSKPEIIDPETGRFTEIRSKLPYHFAFNGPVYFAHPHLKLKPQGKNLFEISASGFAYTNNFRVTELGRAFIHKEYEMIRKAAEHSDGGFDLRLAFGRQFRKTELMIGFAYSQRRISADYDFNYSEKPLIDADGRIIGYDVNTPKHIRYTSKHILTFVEVPIFFRQELKVLNNGQRIRLNIGFVPQFLKGISGSLPNAQFLDLKENLSTENYRSAVLGGELGISYLIPVYKACYINIQPYYTFNSGFRQIQAYYSNKFNYIGLRAGLQMRL